jgi:flagellar L-ring protein precursor FlgH
VKPALALRLALPLALALCAGCASQQPYTPRHRDYQGGASEQESAPAQSPGSLWRDGGPGMLFSDQRAHRALDLVVIRVEEIADARRSSDTDLSRRSTMALEVQAFLKQAGLVQQLSRGADVGLNANSDTAFKADGQTGRTERLTATVPAVVRKVLANGNLFVEGHRVVLVNSEEQHFYISGVIRPIDIDQDDTVKSSMVADAEIEFTGRGVLSDNQHQGLVSRFFHWIWPF